MLFSPVRSAFVLGIALGLAFASTACDGSIGIPSAPSSVSRHFADHGFSSWTQRTRGVAVPSQHSTCGRNL